jgi:hypothetical protein
MKEEFVKVKERILCNLKNGDGIEIARRAGLNYKVWQNAEKKETWESLTSGEMKFVLAAIAFLKERDELIEYAANL